MIGQFLEMANDPANLFAVEGPIIHQGRRMGMSLDRSRTGTLTFGHTSGLVSKSPIAISSPHCGHSIGPMSIETGTYGDRVPAKMAATHSQALNNRGDRVITSSACTIDPDAQFARPEI